MNLPALKEALHASRPKLSALSRKTGIAEGRLLAIYNDEEPSLKEWRTLSKALKLSARLAAPVVQPESRYGFLFRSPVGGKQVSSTLLSTLSRKMMLYDELRTADSSVSLASAKAHFVGHKNYMDAEANAVLFRKMFAEDDQDRPLHDLPAIISKRLAVKIFLIETKGIEGASVVSSDDAFIFLAKRFAPRMLFTLAHEVAHLLFHQGDSAEFVSIDSSSSGRSTESPSKDASYNELFAHAFASALLMPDGAVGRVLKLYRQKAGVKGPLGDIEINILARFFGVSFFAAATRCESLRLLPTGGASSLDLKIREEFGSAEKRAAELGLPPRINVEFPYFPEDLLAAAITRIREGSLSIGRASSELGITVEDLISANEQLVH